MFQRLHRLVFRGLPALPMILCLIPPVSLAAQAAVPAVVKMPVKVVVVAMFENGLLTGDRPGEFQFWVERMPLDQELPFPLGPYPLRMNGDGVLGVCIGGGIANATATIMALGLDPRFDLRQSYWLIAGIAGGDPHDTSLGSAVWAKHVVDGDLLYEIDGREIPPDWPYGMIPLGSDRPAQTPADITSGWTLDNVHFALNAALADWAFGLTRNLAIDDHAGLGDARKAYVGYPRAMAPPSVMLGDTLSSSTYWHGALLNAWANDWVRLHAGEAAEFVTTNMEDSGTLTALSRLQNASLVDASRVMVLRTVSNFSMPPPGKPAAWSATADYAGNGLPALESAYAVGRKVVDALVTDWPTYAVSVPAAPR